MSSTPSRTRDGDVSPGGNVPGSATGSPARRWGALAVLMLPVLLISIDNTVLTVALPQISLDFSASGTLLLWIVDIY